MPITFRRRMHFLLGRYIARDNAVKSGKPAPPIEDDLSELARKPPDKIEATKSVAGDKWSAKGFAMARKGFFEKSISDDDSLPPQIRDVIRRAMSVDTDQAPVSSNQQTHSERLDSADSTETPQVRSKPRVEIPEALKALLEKKKPYGT